MTGAETLAVFSSCHVVICIIAIVISTITPNASDHRDAVGELTFPSCCFDGDLLLSRCLWEFFFSLVLQNIAKMGLSLSLVIDFALNPLCSS